MVFFVFAAIPDRYKNQEICDWVNSEDPFLILYCPEKYKTQRMCDKAVDNYLAALKPINDWLFSSKMMKELLTALYAEENIRHFNGDYLMKISYFLVMKSVFLR